MMQHPARLDQNERAVERAYVENVGLGVFDPTREGGRRFPLGVAKAGKAEIDGEDARVSVLARELDRMPSGAASGDENIKAGGIRERTERSRGKLITQVLVDGGRLRDRGSMHP